ncbi:hypothetical protein MHYP_G00257320 [Metynnis hypsauchen]
MQAREERDDKLMANALRRGCQHSRLPLKAPVARADCGGMNQSLPASVILRGPGPKSTGFLRKLRCTAAVRALSVNGRRVTRKLARIDGSPCLLFFSNHSHTFGLKEKTQCSTENAAHNETQAHHVLSPGTRCWVCQ